MPRSKEIQDLVDLLRLPKREFIELNLKWIEEENDKKLMNVAPLECPLAMWVVYNDAKCHHELVPNTATCPLCGHLMCPNCSNHAVDTISRVTGYLSSVSGWNEAKQQEFKDRNRYDMGESRPRGR